MSEPRVFNPWMHAVGDDYDSEGVWVTASEVRDVLTTSHMLRKQDNDLRNCMPSVSTVRACREREETLRAEAAQHQKRIDAIQKKLDEAIGVTDE